MNKSTYGESLFECYLESQKISFEREPELPGISQRIDFVVMHPTHGKLLFEIKDIETPPPIAGGAGAFDPYKPIREHIEEGTRKFKSTSDYICVLVLVAAPNSFVDLQTPEFVLGAMYGDFGFKIPFNVNRGEADQSQITSEFLLGNGKMVRKSRLQNTRISALITLHEFHVWHYAMRKYIHTDDGRTFGERANDIFQGRAGLPAEDKKAIGVTVWENATARKRLPPELFRGPMDAWWTLEDNAQTLTFVGEARRELEIDKRGKSA